MQHGPALLGGLLGTEDLGGPAEEGHHLAADRDVGLGPELHLLPPLVLEPRHHTKPQQGDLVTLLRGPQRQVLVAPA